MAERLEELRLELAKSVGFVETRWLVRHGGTA
jgi:hypothetical protein